MLYSRICQQLGQKVVITVLLWTAVSFVQAEELIVAAANSTCSALMRVGESFVNQYSDHPLNISYRCKSSGRLAKGLRGKSITANLYISANQSWMEYMIDSGLVTEETVAIPWGNQLVIATASDSTIEVDSLKDLSSESISRILIGDPSTAPFGRYTKEALKTTGVWNKVRPKIETVRHITLLSDQLTLADPGTVGILFKTNVTNHHRVIHTIEKSGHSPILYFIAPIGESADDPITQRFIRYLKGDTGKEIFLREGFDIQGD